MNKKARVHVFISGRVQGVFFRENTRKQAVKLGLVGWVQNLDDGRVEAVFEGEKEKIDRMISWARKGSAFAKVKNVDVREGDFCGEFQNFEIKK